jgi:hypothetical protein
MLHGDRATAVVAVHLYFTRALTFIFRLLFGHFLGFTCPLGNWLHGLLCTMSCTNTIPLRQTCNENLQRKSAAPAWGDACISLYLHLSASTCATHTTGKRPKGREAERLQGFYLCVCNFFSFCSRILGWSQKTSRSRTGEVSCTNVPMMRVSWPEREKQQNKTKGLGLASVSMHVLRLPCCKEDTVMCKKKREKETPQHKKL